MIMYLYRFNLTKPLIRQIAGAIYILAMAIGISGIWSPIIGEKALVCIGYLNSNCFISPTWNWAFVIASITIVISTSALTILAYWGINTLKQKAIDREREKLAKGGFFI